MAIAICGLGLCPCFAEDLGKTECRPNIVFILADDLGYGDVGAYKKKPSKIPTPNVDRIAREGVRFTDAHSPSSVCSPTRYALLTGRYAWRTRLRAGVVGIYGPPLIAAERLTVASYLKGQGYATAAIGKWHLGLTWPTVDGAAAFSKPDGATNVDFTRPIGDAPTTRGFDYYFGVDLPNFPPYCFVENDRTVGLPDVPDAGEAEGFNRRGPMLRGWKLVDILPEVTRRAVGYIEQTAAKKQPFFLYLPLTSPHYPVVPAAEFRSKTTVGDYGDFVHQTDWCVGQVLAALEKAGVADDTLVIFTSDNGPEVSNEVKPGVYDRIKQYGHHSLDGLRGAKRDLWEAGHRVPFVARWPAKITAGAVCDRTICHVDLLATVAEITGGKIPNNAGEDSVSFLPALLGSSNQPPRESLVHQGGSGHLAIRRGDWVLIAARSGEANGPTLGEPEWLKKERGYTDHDQPGELYNLRDDLIEAKNLYADRPEMVADLTQRLQKQIDAGRSTPGEPQPNDVPVPIDPPKPARPRVAK
ncbi:MAG: arylsulfatase [Planctomycetes bacterium]|nr:arylsulfatase [Planctomycetota bacterium]